MTEPADGGNKTLTHAEAEHEHESHDHDGDSHEHPDTPGRRSNEESFSKKDLTNRGSMSDLMKRSHAEECVDDSFNDDTRQHMGIEQDIRHIVGANFHEVTWEIR